jgi:hypothetical protein
MCYRDENHSACTIVMRITFTVSDPPQLVWPGRDAKGYAEGREGGAETEDQTAKGPDVGSVEASKLGRPNSKGEPLVALMLTRIVCPNCGHVGATSASLPRVLICFQCGHGGLIMAAGRRSLPPLRGKSRPQNTKSTEITAVR